MGRVRAYCGNFGVLLRALAYTLAYGPGLRQATEDAVLNANYIRKNLEESFDLPYNLPSMHEVVFSDARQKRHGVNTMDIAKRLIDYGFHPYTTAFPSDRPRRDDDRSPRSRNLKRNVTCLSRPCARSRSKRRPILNW